MPPDPQPCPECGRGNPVRVHRSCFPREHQDDGGTWLFWCVFCDRYYNPGQTTMQQFTGDAQPRP